MKKFLIFIGSFALIFTLVGCQKTNASDAKIPATTSGQLADFNKKIKAFHPNDFIPTNITNTTKKKYLNVTNQGDKQNFQINYGFTNKYTEFGKQPDTDLVTSARLIKKTYTNENLATKDIKFIDQTKLGKTPTIDLGNNVKAYLMRDSTHLYSLINRDKYSILVRANSTKAEHPDELTKKINQLLAKATLPQTLKGSLTADVSADKNSFPINLTWLDSKNKTVAYQLFATSPEVLFSMLK